MGESVTPKQEANDILDILNDQMGVKRVDPNTLSPQTMAFVGDAVYSLCMRSIVVGKGNTNAKRLHTATSELVSAKAQARMYQSWYDGAYLTDEERDILRRGVNAKTNSQAKNASSYEYHLATAVEALSGYLYEGGQLDRLIYLISKGLE